MKHIVFRVAFAAVRCDRAVPPSSSLPGLLNGRRLLPLVLRGAPSRSPP